MLFYPGIPDSRMHVSQSLTSGDQFYIHVLDEMFSLELSRMKVVEPDDISDIFIEEGEGPGYAGNMYPVPASTPWSGVKGAQVRIPEEKKEHQVDRQEESTWKQAYKEAIAEGVKWTLVGLAILADVQQAPDT